MQHGVQLLRALNTIKPRPCLANQVIIKLTSNKPPSREMPHRDFTSLPILDLSLSEGDDASSFLTDLRVALTDVGFLYVSNHGVPQPVIDNLVRVLPKLFALPGNAKREIALENSPHFLGYSAAGTETTAGRCDQREQVEFATELTKASEGSPLYDGLRGPNQVGRSSSSYPRIQALT